MTDFKKNLKFLSIVYSNESQLDLIKRLVQLIRFDTVPFDAISFYLI